jgi:secreted trypsin-like serine protease
MTSTRLILGEMAMYKILLLLHLSAYAAVDIIGGNIAEEDPTSPYLLFSYEYKVGDKLYWQNCSGTKVWSNLILTAAHCMEKSSLKTPNIYVTNKSAVQRQDMTSNAVMLQISVKDIFIHPNYGELNFHNDLAFISVDSHNSSFRQWKSAPMSTSPEDVASSLRLYGYGDEEIRDMTPYSPEEWKHKKYIDVPLYSLTKLYNEALTLTEKIRHMKELQKHLNNPVHKNMIMTRKEYTQGVFFGSLSGDSGGPVLSCQKASCQVVGVTSIYYKTKIGKYIEGDLAASLAYSKVWIDTIMENVAQH